MTPAAEASPVAIVGGGLAGLTAAFTLQQAGIPFRLFEASARFGGVIRTEHAEGFLLEAGPDALLAQKPAGLALCRTLGLESRLVPTNQEQRKVYVLWKGRLLPFPEGAALGVPSRVGPFLKSGLFSWPAKLRMGLDLVRPARRDTSDESIEAFVRRRFGGEAVPLVAGALLAGIHAGDASRLSIRATFPRLSEMETRYGSVIRGMRAGGPPAAGTAVFYSLVGGMQELVDALVSRLPSACVHASAAVSTVERASGGWTVVMANGESQAARAVLVATPPRHAARLVHPHSSAAGDSLAQIRSASTATILLGYPEQAVTTPLDGYGLLVPRGEGQRTTACSFSSTKLPGRAPAGHVLLRAFVGGTHDPQVLDLDDNALAELVHQEMSPVLGLHGRPSLARVFRWPEGTPQMEVGHLDRMADLERALVAVPGLYVTGAGLRGTGIPDTIADAVRVATAAASALGPPKESSSPLAKGAP